MSDLQDIKKAIYEEGRIEEVLDLLGCKNIHPERNRIVASLPNGNNMRSVQVRMDKDLYSNIRSKGINGDIFAIVSYIKFNCSTKAEIYDNLFDAKMWIVEELDYFHLVSKDNKKEKKQSYNNWLKDMRKKRGKKVGLEDLHPNIPIPESTKDKYLMEPYYLWIKEGISWETQKEWEIGFCWESHRIITLIRNITGELIGVKGRAMDDENPWKYLYVEEMNKSIELFGLHKTLPYILEQKEVILFEGYKSVFKAWQMGYKNVASIEGDDISPAQVALIKSFGLDIKIVMCYDKDKTEDKIIEQVSRFGNRKVYYTLDKKKFLGEKQSPVDKGLITWKRLYENKIEFTP